jgi:hypothetical protein
MSDHTRLLSSSPLTICHAGCDDQASPLLNGARSGHLRFRPALWVRPPAKSTNDACRSMVGFAKALVSELARASIFD